MKNRNKLNDAFSDIDGKFIEETAAPSRMRKAKLILIPLVAAALVIAIAAATILPAMMNHNPETKTPIATPSDTNQATESPTASDESGVKTDYPSETPTVSVVTPTIPTLSSEPMPTPVQFEVPAWYAPGELSVQSLTLKSAYSGVHARRGTADGLLAASNVSISAVGNPTGIVGSRYVNMTGVSAESEHNTHGCLIYDLKKNEMVCYMCLVKDLLAEKGIVLGETERIVIDAMTDMQLISFAVYDEPQDKITARYIYEPEAELLRSVPLLSTQDFDFFRVNSECSYLLTGSRRSDTYVDFYLIDVSSLGYKQVGEGYRTFHEGAHFSPDGKSLLLLIADEKGMTYIDTDRANRLLVNVSTGQSVITQGKILSYANDLLITRVRDVYHAYDRTTCTEVSIPENTYVFEARAGSILRINAFTGREEVLLSQPDAWKLSDDGLYAYAYCTGDNFLCVYSLENGENFYVELSMGFADTVKKLSADKDISYMLDLNDAGSELLICYSTRPKMSPPVANPHEKIKEAFLKSDSIIDFVLNFEELWDISVKYQVYRGEGFTQLYVEGYLAVEDYRNDSFTLYTDKYYNHNKISLVCDDYGNTQTVICSSTKEETDAFIEKRGWTVKEADVDYARFYIDGEFSLFLARDYITTPEYLEKVPYFTTLFDNMFGIRTDNVEAVRAFIAELHACEKVFSTSVPYSDVYKAYITLTYGGSGERLLPWIWSKGIYSFQAYNNNYFVPEYVYADFISLVAGIEFSKKGTIAVTGGTEFEDIMPYTRGLGTTMTLEELTRIFEGGITRDELYGYTCRALSYRPSTAGYIGHLNLLYRVVEGDQLIGYAYVDVMSDGEVRNLFLFDENYRYIAYPAIDGMPEGDWIYKGRLDYNFASQTQENAKVYIAKIGMTVELTSEEKECVKEALKDLRAFDGDFTYFDAIFEIDGATWLFNIEEQVVNNDFGLTLSLPDAPYESLCKIIEKYAEMHEESQPVERMYLYRYLYGSTDEVELTAEDYKAVVALLYSAKEKIPFDYAFDYDYAFCDEQMKFLYNTVTGKVAISGSDIDPTFHQYQLREETRSALNAIIDKYAMRDDITTLPIPTPTPEEITQSTSARYMLTLSDVKKGITFDLASSDYEKIINLFMKYDERERVEDITFDYYYSISDGKLWIYEYDSVTGIVQKNPLPWCSQCPCRFTLTESDRLALNMIIFLCTEPTPNPLPMSE